MEEKSDSMSATSATSVDDRGRFISSHTTVSHALTNSSVSSHHSLPSRIDEETTTDEDLDIRAADHELPPPYGVRSEIGDMAPSFAVTSPLPFAFRSPLPATSTLGEGLSFNPHYRGAAPGAYATSPAIVPTSHSTPAFSSFVGGVDKIKDGQSLFTTAPPFSQHPRRVWNEHSKGLRAIFSDSTALPSVLRREDIGDAICATTVSPIPAADPVSHPYSFPYMGNSEARIEGGFRPSAPFASRSPFPVTSTFLGRRSSFHPLHVEETAPGAFATSSAVVPTSHSPHAFSSLGGGDKIEKVPSPLTFGPPIDRYSHPVLSAHSEDKRDDLRAPLSGFAALPNVRSRGDCGAAICATTASPIPAADPVSHAHSFSSNIGSSEARVGGGGYRPSALAPAAPFYDSPVATVSPFGRQHLSKSKYPRYHILSFFPEAPRCDSREITEKRFTILEETFRRALNTLNDTLLAINFNASKEAQEMAGIIFDASQKGITKDLIKVVIATLNLVTDNEYGYEYRRLAELMSGRSSAIMKKLSRAMYELDTAIKPSWHRISLHLDDERMPSRFRHDASETDRSFKNALNFLPYDGHYDLKRNSEKDLKLMCSWILNSLAKTLYDNPFSHSQAVVKSAEKLLDGLFTIFISSQDKQSMLHLMDISIATMNYLNGHIDYEKYNQFANKMQQHSSLSLRVLGGLMLALGAVMMACGAAIGLGLAAPVVGVAAATGAGVAAAGLALTSVGVAFFAKKSVSKQVVESMKELNNKIYDMSSWRSSSSSM